MFLKRRNSFRKYLRLFLLAFLGLSDLFLGSRKNFKSLRFSGSLIYINRVLSKGILIFKIR